MNYGTLKRYSIEKILRSNREKFHGLRGPGRREEKKKKIIINNFPNNYSLIGKVTMNKLKKERQITNLFSFKRFFQHMI